MYFAKRVEILEVDCYKRGINNKSQTNMKNEFTYFRKAKDRVYVADSIYNFINEKESKFKYKEPFYLRSIQFYLAAMSININYLYNTSKFDIINEMLYSKRYILKSSKKLVLKYRILNLIYGISFNKFSILYALLKKR